MHTLIDGRERIQLFLKFQRETREKVLWKPGVSQNEFREPGGQGFVALNLSRWNWLLEAFPTTSLRWPKLSHGCILVCLTIKTQ